MGICYRVIILDEFNWDYIGFNREMLKEEVVRRIPHAQLEADLRCMIIFDIEKTPPEVLRGMKWYDKIVYMQDNDLEIRELEESLDGE